MLSKSRETPAYARMLMSPVDFYSGIRAVLLAPRAVPECTLEEGHFPPPAEKSTRPHAAACSHSTQSKKELWATPAGLMAQKVRE